MRRLTALVLVAAVLLLAGYYLVPSLRKAPDGATLSSADAERIITKQSREAFDAIKNNDMSRLAKLVHPDKGVRFSPYAYVQAKSDGDVVLTRQQLPIALTDKTIHLWGVFDGSGEPINLTFADYYNRFVADHDWVNAPQVGYNKIVKQGNMVINLRDVYPHAVYVEAHYPGSDQYAGMDWSSLRLVFEAKGGKWYLVGIIHDQWTT